jgi:hypothetical protein
MRLVDTRIEWILNLNLQVLRVFHEAYKATASTALFRERIIIPCLVLRFGRLQVVFWNGQAISAVAVPEVAASSGVLILLARVQLAVD